MCVSRLAGFVLFKLFNSVTAGIQVHRGQMEMIKAAADVYNQYSYFDFILDVTRFFARVMFPSFFFLYIGATLTTAFLRLSYSATTSK